MIYCRNTTKFGACTRGKFSLRMATKSDLGVCFNVPNVAPIVESPRKFEVLTQLSRRLATCE